MLIQLESLGLVRRTPSGCSREVPPSGDTRVTVAAILSCFAFCYVDVHYLHRACVDRLRPPVCVCGSWQRSRPVGGLALPRTSPQAQALVGCLVSAPHVSWLSAVRLYPTLGRLPGGGAVQPPPHTHTHNPTKHRRPHHHLTHG